MWHQHTWSRWRYREFDTVVLGKIERWQSTSVQIKECPTCGKIKSRII